MKINTDERALEALKSEIPFDEQLDAAQVSGRPFGIVVDAKKGRCVIYHTADEIAQFGQRAIEHEQENADDI